SRHMRVPSRVLPAASVRLCTPPFRSLAPSPDIAATQVGRRSLRWCPDSPLGLPASAPGRIHRRSLRTHGRAGMKRALGAALTAILLVVVALLGSGLVPIAAPVTIARPGHLSPE